MANPISNDNGSHAFFAVARYGESTFPNLNRQQDRVRMFESGLRFVGQLDGLKQEPMLGWRSLRRRLTEGWAQGRDDVEFFDVKADVEAVWALPVRGCFTFLPGSQRRCNGPDCTHRVQVVW